MTRSFFYKIFVFVLTCFSLTFSTDCLAQDSYGTGYYINNDSDTIKGLIRYQPSYRYSVDFKSSRKSKKTRLTISEVRRFGYVNGPVYRRLDFSTKEVSTKPVFAAVLFDGSIDLFKFGVEFFIEGSEKNRFFLAKGRSSNTDDINRNYRQNIGYFNILFKDCEAVNIESRKISVSAGSLVRILKKYHECKRDPYSIYEWKRKSNYNLGFFIGNNTSTLSFNKGNDPVYRSFDKFSFNSSTNLSFGVSGIIKFRNPISLLSIQNELVYSKGSFSAEYFDQSDVGGGVTAKETIKTDVDYKLLTYKVGPRISIRSNSINPYVAFGFSIPIMKTVGIKSIRTTQINNATPEVQELKPIASLPNFWLSIGVKKKVASDYALYFELTNDLKGGDTGTGQVSGLTSKIGFLF